MVRSRFLYVRSGSRAVDAWLKFLMWFAPCQRLTDEIAERESALSNLRKNLLEHHEHLDPPCGHGRSRCGPLPSSSTIRV
jgi:hypothetical protein